jgi:hypothetical protein
MQKSSICSACKHLTQGVIELNLGEFGTGPKTSTRRFAIEKITEGNVLIDFRVVGDHLLYLLTSDDPAKQLVALLVRFVYKTGKSHLAEINPHEKYPDIPVLLDFDVTPDGRFINCIAIELPAQVLQKTYQSQLKDIFHNLFPRHYSSKHRYSPLMNTTKPNLEKPPMILEAKMGKWAMLTLLDELGEEKPENDLIMCNKGQLNQIQSRAVESRPETIEFLHIKPNHGVEELVYYYVVITQNCYEVILFKLIITPKEGKSVHEVAFKTNALWTPVCHLYQAKLFDTYRHGVVVLPYQRTVTILNRGQDKIMQIVLRTQKKGTIKKSKD